MCGSMTFRQSRSMLRRLSFAWSTTSRTRSNTRTRPNRSGGSRSPPASTSAKVRVVRASSPSLYVITVSVSPLNRGRSCFGQFYRAHEETVTDIDGSGLGLNIVRETVESLGGRAWAEFPETGGAVFAFSLPSRREEDAAAAGTRRLGEAQV